MTAAPKSPAEAIRLCLEYPSKLSDWERDFLLSIQPVAERPNLRLTPKQIKIVRRLTARIINPGREGQP